MDSRRLHLTVLFSDLCESTRLGNLVDPEVYREVLHAIKDAAGEVVRKHAGVLNQDYGDGLMVVFGLPSSHEDDVRRATEAAIELHRVIPRLDLHSLLPGSFQLNLHSGVDSGLVLVGQGDPLQGRYELMGDAVNTAKKLSDAAGPNQIIVSESTLRGSREFFTTTRIPPLPVKGRDDPIAAYQVTGRSAVATRFEASISRGLTRFVGRRPELQRLRDAWLETCGGRLRVVTVVGDPGLGKTRIVDEFIDRIQSTSGFVFRGYCESYGDVAPLQPFAQMLRQFLRIDESSAGSSVEALGSILAELNSELSVHKSDLLHLLRLRADGAPGAGAPIAALAKLFVALAARRPLVLFIDDWHWADDASRQVLGSTIGAAHDLPILVITASRSLDPSDPAMSGAEILQLHPFNETESAASIGALIPDHFEPGLAAGIHQRAGGNALFIEELCQSWAARQPADRDTVVPATLYDLIEARIERLPRTQRELVSTAAIIGRVIPVWLFEELTGRGEHHRLTRRLADNDLLYAGDTKGTLRFKHGITREVVYESVSLTQRRALHLQVAELLLRRSRSSGGEPPYAALANHYAGGGQYRSAVRYAELAGDKALTASSLDRARQHYRMAMNGLEKMRHTPELRRRWISISVRWAMACVYSPAKEQLPLLLRTVEYARDLGDLEALAESQYWLGFINYGLGDQPQAIRNYEHALPLAIETGNPKLATQIQANLGQSYAAACSYDRALAHLNPAIAAKRKAPSRSNIPVGTAYAVATKALVLADQGNFAEADGLMGTALSAIAGMNHQIEGSILNMRCAALFWQGRWEEAASAARRAQSIAERVHGPYVFAMSRAIQGYAAWTVEGSVEALEILRQACRWLEAREVGLYASLVYGWLTDAMTSAGNRADARLYGARALAAAGNQDRLGEAMACRALARIADHARNSKSKSAEHYLSVAMESAEARKSRHELAVTLLARSQLSAAADRPEETRRLLRQARREFEDMNMLWHQRRCDMLTARLDA